MSPERELEQAEEMLAAIKAGARERWCGIKPNECPACGSYRLDGLPPELHEHGCPYENDGIDRFIKRRLSTQPSTQEDSEA